MFNTAFAVAPVPILTVFADTSTDNGATNVLFPPIEKSSVVDVNHVIVPESVNREPNPAKSEVKATVP